VCTVLFILQASCQQENTFSSLVLRQIDWEIGRLLGGPPYCLDPGRYGGRYDGRRLCGLTSRGLGRLLGGPPSCLDPGRYDGRYDGRRLCGLTSRGLGRLLGGPA
jgi:hypothetical protein